MSPTHKKEDVSAARRCRRRDDIRATAGHVPRRTVPLLAAMRLQVLQVERVPVVEQQRLARPRGHVHSRRCVKTISVRVRGARVDAATIRQTTLRQSPHSHAQRNAAQIHLDPDGYLRFRRQGHRFR